MDTFSALLAICAGNSPIPGEFPTQRPVTRSFDVFLDLCLNKWLSKQPWGWWFESLSSPLWRHRNDNCMLSYYSCGGNLLMNVGPTHDGRIVPIFEERLRQMGEWLNINGPAIYKTKPWTHQNDTITPKIWWVGMLLQNLPIIFVSTLVLGHL